MQSRSKASRGTENTVLYHNDPLKKGSTRPHHDVLPGNSHLNILIPGKVWLAFFFDNGGTVDSCAAVVLLYLFYGRIYGYTYTCSVNLYKLHAMNLVCSQQINPFFT